MRSDTKRWKAKRLATLRAPKGKRGRRFVFGLATLSAFSFSAPVTIAQLPAMPAAPVAAQPSLPAPIYWKQNLFLIPYQWSSAAEPSSAVMVTLYVSKDRGANWQKISEAKPQVKAFNYRAEGDGEYWFAVRTLDNLGHSSPFGPFQPELRVIVDTTIPRIEQLQARPTLTGAIDIQCRATDANLEPASLRYEAQIDASGTWHPVPAQPVQDAANPALGSLLHATFQPPANVHLVAIRATISDKAGNSTVYQTPVDATPLMSGPSLSQPAIAPLPSNPSAAISPPPTLPQTQPWPAGGMANAPFQLWTSGKTSADDGVTAFGSPTISAAKTSTHASSPSAFATAANQPRVPAQFAGAVKTDAGWTSAPTATPTGPQFSPLEPFREPTSPASSTSAAGPSLVPLNQLTAAAPPTSALPPATATSSITPIDTATSPTHRPTSPPKLVGSRTFALEYDLDDAGSEGVARVELWGTRDGGQTWNRYTVDNDNRSPLIATVDSEGLYGFKILVQSATGAPITAPRSGEEPELWVSVDLHRPTVELTTIERGEGNLSDHLILHWRAQDNNLEAKPIGLFFSSRPTGPWSVIATNLENTGDYAWRVERYVPSRIYLRVEARDTAGNLAAFQTREPVEFNSVPTAGRLKTPPNTATAIPTANPVR